MITNKTNKDIRERLNRLGLFMWQFAAKCDVSASTMTVWMREELPSNDPRRVHMEEVLDELERSD